MKLFFYFFVDLYRFIIGKITGLFTKPAHVELEHDIAPIKFKPRKLDSNNFKIIDILRKGYGYRGIARQTGLSSDLLKRYRNNELPPLKARIVSTKLRNTSFPKHPTR